MKPTTPTGSGSHGSHARLNASGAKCWMNCTAAPAYCQANQDRILPDKVGQVKKLIPYLKSIPKDEVRDYEVRAMQVTTYFNVHGKTILGEQAISDIERTAGSEASREGTRAHDYAEAILNERKAITDIPQEFRTYVGEYVDHCRSLMTDTSAVLIEAKVPLFYSPGDTGTVDFAVVDELPVPDNDCCSYTRITIRDLKYGAGIKVDAEGNEQLAIYALGLVNMLENDPDLPTTFNPLSTMVDIGIVQPRHHEGGDIRTWVISLNDLRRFCYDIGLAAGRINNGDVEFAPSEDACRWCDAKAFCEARLKALETAHSSPDCTGIDFIAALPDLSKEDAKAPVEDRLTLRKNEANEALVMPESSALTLTDDRVMQVFSNAKAIRAWLDDIEEYVNNRAQAGDDFGGRVKLVLGRQGNTEWKDETAAETFLKNQGLKSEERYNYKLKSPTQAKEILGDRLKVKRTASRFAELTTRSEAKPVVALASDKRPAITPSVNLLPSLEGGQEISDEEGMS